MKRMYYYDWVKFNWAKEEKDDWWKNFSKEHKQMIEFLNDVLDYEIDMDVVGYDSASGYKTPVIEIAFPNGNKVYLYGIKFSLISVESTKDVDVNFDIIGGLYHDGDLLKEERKERVSKKFPMYGTYHESKSKFTMASFEVMSTYAALIMLFNAWGTKKRTD